MKDTLTKDEVFELGCRLFVVSHCARQISDLLTGRSECGLDKTMPPISKHLHRVSVYGTVERWVELSGMASATAQVFHCHPEFSKNQGDDPAISMAMNVLDILKPDFQAYPDLMRKLYGFDQVLTGGSELRAFDIEGELPPG